MILAARLKALAAVLCIACASNAFAGGPRFVTGTNFSGAPAGKMMAFYTSNLRYFTDPGDLNAAVPHAQADAMVAAAASVWNISVASLTLSQGGTLAEHVSDQNSYFTGAAIVFPADVEPSNYLTIPIAVLYDTDGSLTDLLLGSGASDPSACHHNAVTESVDSFGQTGVIQHAVIVLNGRCVGSAPQQLLQMQYQLERIFGRVLGLAWAQVNNNVFTAALPVTAGQIDNWPIMHPIDVICGVYTYQCMPNPFQLRTDDIASLALLYPVTSANAASGKTPTLNANSVAISGGLYFSASQGMEDANIVVEWGIQGLFFDNFETVSALSGAQYQRNGGNPVTGRTIASADNAGSGNNGYEGSFTIPYLPMNFSSGRPNTASVYAESINPLYSGEYAIGTYEGTPRSIYGSSSGPSGFFTGAGFNWGVTLLTKSEPTACSTGNDGTEQAPVAADSSGWWTGLLCGPGHVSWWQAAIRPGRTWTLETTALDETGAPTESKLKPVIGVWKSTDPTGGLPTVAATSSPMNSMSVGMTQLVVPSAAQTQTVRIAIADALGAGRPDFTYKARILYADSIAPASIGSGGGTVTLTGTGFRAGNQVTVNGVAATVTSWTSTRIVAVVPPITVTGGTVGTPVDVTVTDPGTAGQTTMSAVLTYTAAGALTLATTPEAHYIAAGASVTWPASVLATQNAVPDAGIPITWTSTGSLTLSVTQTTTGSAGTSAINVQATNVPGATTSTVAACAWTTICSTGTVYSVAASLWSIAVTGGAGQSLQTGASLAPVTFQVTDGSGHPLQGAAVQLYQTVDAWEGVCPAHGPCPAAPILAGSATAAISDVNGFVTLTPLQVPNVPQVLNIAASTGTQGFVTLTLDVTP